MAQTMTLLDSLCAKKGGAALDAYSQLFYTLRCAGYEGVGQWLGDYLRYESTPYAKLAEFGGSDPALENAARRELEVLTAVALIDCDEYINAMIATAEKDARKDARNDKLIFDIGIIVTATKKPTKNQYAKNNAKYSFYHLILPIS